MGSVQRTGLAAVAAMTEPKMNKVMSYQKQHSSTSPGIAANPMLVVVRVLHRQFSVTVNAENIEDAENLVSSICEPVDFQIMNVVRIK